MSLNAQFYFLSPVEVVKVTPQNLQEVAEWCGGVVAQTESRRKPGTMDKYVWVPTPEGAKVSSAFPGMYVTRRLVATNKGEIKVTWAVFRRDYFDANYFGSPSEALEATWGKQNPQIIADKRKQPADLIPVLPTKTKEATNITINLEGASAAAVAELPKVIQAINQENGTVIVNEERRNIFEKDQIGRDAGL